MRDRSVTVELSRPVQRVPVRLFNGVATRYRGRWGPAPPVRVDDLVRTAQRRTGLTSFGSPTFRPGLTRLVDALNAWEDVSPFGRHLARTVVIEVLCNRLYVEGEWRRRRIVDAVRAPLIVVGLPRTGTTLLHQLLACDPAHRCLTNWEGTRPAAPPGWRRMRPVRALWSGVGLTLQNYLAPGLPVIHASHVYGPEECTTLLMAEFASQAFTAPFDIPEYVSWLDRCDYRASAAYHRRQLAVLPLTDGQERWLLKSPNHLPGLDALLEIYPEARIVHLHRDPAKVTSSCASLVSAFRGLFARRLDGARIGAQTLRTLDAGLRRAVAGTESERGGRILDVQYADLMRDPVATVSAIYRHFDLPSPPALRRGMARVLARARRGPHRRHRYSLAQFGLDRDAVRRRFAWYVSRFAIPGEA